MIVIPAVDVLGKDAVRLERGDFGREAVSRRNPFTLIRQFAEAGAALIHVVDLDGARSGRLRPELVGSLAEAAAPVPIQAAGGIRSLEDARALLACGAARVVVGTAALASDSAALQRFAAELGDRLVVAIDARGGRVAVSGWEQSLPVAPEAAAEACARAGVERLLCTAIERDGTMLGPDLGLLERVRHCSALPVIAAGGIRSKLDLAAVHGVGCEGAIVGRALLEGALPLSVLGFAAA